MSLALDLCQHKLKKKKKIRIFEMLKITSQWFSISVNSVDFFRISKLARFIV